MPSFCRIHLNPYCCPSLTSIGFVMCGLSILQLLFSLNKSLPMSHCVPQVSLNWPPMSFFSLFWQIQRHKCETLCNIWAGWQPNRHWRIYVHRCSFQCLTKANEHKLALVRGWPPDHCCEFFMHFINLWVHFSFWTLWQIYQTSESLPHGYFL